MKLLATLLAILLLSVLVVPAKAGHSTNNGTCTDDAIHWQNMINKRTDAPLWNESKATQAEAMAANVQGDWERCEELMVEALRMIKKTAGEYPTE